MRPGVKLWHKVAIAVAIMLLILSLIIQSTDFNAKDPLVHAVFPLAYSSMAAHMICGEKSLFNDELIQGETIDCVALLSNVPTEYENITLELWQVTFSEKDPKVYEVYILSSDFSEFSFSSKETRAPWGTKVPLNVPDEDFGFMASFEWYEDGQKEQTYVSDIKNYHKFQTITQESVENKKIATVSSSLIVLGTILGTVFGAIVGGLLTGFLISRNQKSAWKREYQLTNIDRLYLRILPDLKICKKDIELGKRTGLIVWERFIEESLNLLVPKPLRSSLDGFKDVLSKYNEVQLNLEQELHKVGVNFRKSKGYGIPVDLNNLIKKEILTNKKTSGKNLDKILDTPNFKGWNILELREFFKERVDKVNRKKFLKLRHELLVRAGQDISKIERLIEEPWHLS